MSVRVLDRAMDVVTTALDLGEDRRKAWLVATAGLIITVACWWIALATDPSDPIPVGGGRSQSNPVLMIGRMVVVLAGPFLMVAALLQAARRRDEPDTWNDTGLLFNQGARVGAQRRRRAVFAAALITIVNAIALILARY